MGYYTLYSIHFIKGNKDDYYKLLKDAIDKTGNNHLDIDNGYFEQEMKWYDWEKDCYEFSKKYPNLLFMVEGDGEDADDFWRCYFQNGKSAYYEKQWPLFNESDMK